MKMVLNTNSQMANLISFFDRNNVRGLKIVRINCTDSMVNETIIGTIEVEIRWIVWPN